MPEPRDAVRRMRPYSPPTGGRQDMLRLDFNENTVGCSPKVVRMLQQAITGELIATYPEYKAAREKLALEFQVDVEQLTLTNGTDEAIQLLINTYVEPSDEVVILTPSYAMYRFYAEVSGAKIIEVSYGLEGWDFSFRIDRMLEAIGPRTKAIFISNPNNPTGTQICEEEIVRILEASRQACVFVDEAYFEFSGNTVLPLIEAHDNLFVSRTFSKAHGMAAMRCGCLFTNAASAAMLRKAQSPYSVNMLAVLAASEAIADRAYTHAYVESAIEGRRLVQDAFSDLGVLYWPSHANFVLFDAGADADECLQRCRDAGILIRDRRHEAPGALRVTVGPPTQVERFLSIATDLFRSKVKK